MKVSGFGSVNQPGNVRRRGGVTQTGSFADVLAAAESDVAGAVSAANDVASTASLGNLLALQEVSEEETRRQQMMQKGKKLLDTLETLRQRLLIGTLPLDVLLTLEKQIQIEKQSINDPRLAELIDEIELLAAVELAKIERAVENRPGAGDPALPQ